MSRTATKLSDLSIKQRAVLELKFKGKRRNAQRAAIPRQSRERIQFPLSFAQQRLWFMHSWNPDNSAYNISKAMRLEGELNIPVLARAISEVTRRHEILRTIFTLADDQPVQQIVPVISHILSSEDLRDMEAQVSERIVRETIREEGGKPFRLDESPPFRARLLQLGPQESVLILTMHHIVSDRWSMGILLSEMATLYEAFVKGLPSPLPDPPVQYADYAAWEQDWSNSDRMEENLEFWRQQLDLAPGALDLPLKGPRPAIQTFSGARHSFAFPENVNAGLKAMSRQEGVTLFMTLLTAFKILLYRYTGRRDLIVGTPVSGRRMEELEGLIGVFLNMLALRTEISGDVGFRTALRRVREVTLEAFAHQSLPFEKLIEDLQPARDMSHSPLFQVTFSLENEGSRIGFYGLDARSLPVENETTKYDLSLSLTDSSRGLAGTITFNTDIFDRATIERMAEHFCVLLDSILANPDRQIDDLAILTVAERQTMAEDWNRTRRDNPPTCFHHAFERQAELSPHSIAVKFEGEEWSYGHLDQRANRLARYLQSLSVGPETLVGLCMNRSVEMVLGLLAILKAGGAYVPIDPAYPRSRLSFMLSDARAAALLTQRCLLDNLPECDAKIVCIDACEEEIAETSSDSPRSGVEPDNLAYVIYTSGSTGRPKGVQITHHALDNFLRSVRDIPGMTPKDRLLAVTTISFDIAALELLLPLSTGACIEIVSRDTATDGNRLQEQLSRSGATVMQATPATWRLLLESNWPGNKHLKIFCGGEALTRELADKLLAGSSELWNLYGPTEATIWATCDRVEEDDGTISIGRPLSNYQTYVLDSNLALVPVGVKGEMYIGGIGLARGYLNRPALTAERFIPDPFSVRPGSRLYKTGDIARYLPDGRIVILGRADQQVKLRGFRIEMGEIESALRKCEGVRQAVAVVKGDREEEKRLIAYVVADPDNPPSVDHMRLHLQGLLPDYMVPAAFARLERLPLTPNGKIDRNALPTPDEILAERNESFIAPRDTLELKIAQIWEELLRVRPIGVTDRLFELGGHSLLAKRLMIQIEKQFGQEPPLTAFFQNPTIAALAEFLRQRPNPTAPTPLVAIQPLGERRPFFCVHSIGGDVMRFYLLAQLLGEQQPFYAFQAKHPSEIEEAGPSIEEMAERYIAAMRLAQPEGPYLMGGYSFGSIVAFEMAQQLTRSGEEIALLALLDGASPLIHQAARARSDAVVLAGFARDLARVYGVEVNLPHQKIQEMNDEEGMSHILDVLKSHNLVEADTEADYFRRFVRGLRLRTEAIKRYRPAPYAGKIALFRSSFVETESAAAWLEAGVDVYDRSRGWDKLAQGPLYIHYVPGHHATMINHPHAELLARKLGDCLEEAHRRFPQS